MEDYMADNAIQEDLNLPDMPEGDWMEGSAAAANEEDPAQEQLEEEAPPHQEELTQTQAFSRRLREMSSREVDNFVSGLGWTNDITGEPIRTREDFTRCQSQGQRPSPFRPDGGDGTGTLSLPAAGPGRTAPVGPPAGGSLRRLAG